MRHHEVARTPHTSARRRPSAGDFHRHGVAAEIEAFLRTRVTNAATEGTNHLIKDAARIAFGFRNLDNQRRRVRFACTRRHRLATAA